METQVKLCNRSPIFKFVHGGNITIQMSISYNERKASGFFFSQYSIRFLCYLLQKQTNKQKKTKTKQKTKNKTKKNKTKQKQKQTITVKICIGRIVHQDGLILC